jgi:hypothetical protein
MSNWLATPPRGTLAARGAMGGPTPVWMRMAADAVARTALYHAALNAYESANTSV